MRTKRYNKYIGITFIALIFSACVPTLVQKTENKNTPASYKGSQDTTNSGTLRWKEYFTDPYLVSLIDSALIGNQEFNIMIQEIQVAQYDVRRRKAAYLPFVGIGAGAGLEKAGRFTRPGAVDEQLEIAPGKRFPEPLTDMILSARASWEVDIWKKLRNAKKAAYMKFLATDAGKKFMQTHLISEIANSYYELMALDNQLEILNKNIEILTNALGIVKLEKISGRVTELAVKKFEAEVLKNQSRIFFIQQSIVETENRINFLVGRFPQHVRRDSKTFSDLKPQLIKEGIPSQLLANRQDIIRAENELQAAKLDVKVTRAEFYPSFLITGGAGYNAFNPKYFINTPESIIYNLAGELVAPVINRNAIKANYFTANARQTQAVFEYERTVLNAYIEVANQLANIKNLEQAYDYKSKQVDALTESINISTVLFRSARADYMEVLMTQRDALESRFELVETKNQQLSAMVNVYRALGGGWRD